MSKELPLIKDKGYVSLLTSIKARIQIAQHQTARYVNSQLLFTYWHIGYYLNTETKRQGWGAKVVDQLAKDLKSSFPKMKGLSKRNLQYMMRFAAEWPLAQMVQQGAAQIEVPKNKDQAIVQQPVAQLQNTDNQGNEIVPQLVAQLEVFEKFKF